MSRKAIVRDLVDADLISVADATLLEATPATTIRVGTGAAVASVATANADATYGQPEADLINELKDQVNALLVELRARNVIAT